MTLHESNGGGIDFRLAQRFPNRPGLPRLRRRNEAQLVFRIAIIAEAGPADDSLNGVPITDRIIEKLEDQDARTIPEDRSVGSRIKRTNDTRRGAHSLHALLIGGRARKLDSCPSRESGRAFTLPQALRGEIHRHE